MWHNQSSMKKLTTFFIAIMTVLLAACVKQPVEPIRIGFIGGLSGPNSDNGQSGLN
jgi:branched-chain amino acid transport system substrate-binding protein